MVTQWGTRMEVRVIADAVAHIWVSHHRCFDASDLVQGAIANIVTRPLTWTRFFFLSFLSLSGR